MARPWSCYLLIPDDAENPEPSRSGGSSGATTSRSSYVGATTSPDRRLRQHNCEIKGGAKFTTNRVKWGKGRWKRAALVQHFPSERDALQFEWMWKHKTLRQPRGKAYPPLRRRLLALEGILKEGRSTSTSNLFSTFSSPLKVAELCPEGLEFAEKDDLEKIKAWLCSTRRDDSTD